MPIKWNVILNNTFFLNIWIYNYFYVNRYPGNPGLPGDLGESGDEGPQGEPGDSSKLIVELRGEKGNKGVFGEKGVIFY